MEAVVIHTALLPKMKTPTRTFFRLWNCFVRHKTYVN